MEKTKGEILVKNLCNASDSFINFYQDDVLKSMDEYAKQKAIGFAVWKYENYNQVMSNGYESKAIDESANYQRRYTIHELYNIYNQQKQK